MHPREFMDNFWTIEDTKRVFVMMAFAHHAVWKNIIEKAITKSKLQPDRADVPLSGPIPDKILEGIFNARIILVDLSPQLLKDGKTEDQITMKYLYNWNVAYELGIAHAVRQKEEVILISQTREAMPFDIHHWNIHQYSPDNIKNSINKIRDLLNNANQSIDISKSLLVERDSRKLDNKCIDLMRSSKNTSIVDPDPDKTKYKLALGSPNELYFVAAIQKLLDLNLIRSIINTEGSEVLYEWTNKGRATLKYLNL